MHRLLTAYFFISKALGQGHFDIFRSQRACTSGDPAPDEVHAVPIPGPGECSANQLGLPGWETDPINGDLEVWFTGVGIGAGCFVTLHRNVPPNDPVCGEAERRLSLGGCRQLSFPGRYGIVRCCEGEDCPVVGGFPGLLEAEENYNVTTAKDVTTVKRSAPLVSKSLNRRQGNCRFEPSGAPFNSRGTQQRASGALLRCGPGTESCSQEIGTSIAVSATDSYGTTAGVGTDFFGLLQANVEFSYTYEFTETTSFEERQTFSIPPGAEGFATWTPLLECVRGTWRGNCQGWNTDTAGQACIPQRPVPNGIYAFFQTN